jgi:hypothetical protein
MMYTINTSEFKLLISVHEYEIAMLLGLLTTSVSFIKALINSNTLMPVSVLWPASSPMQSGHTNLHSSAFTSLSANVTTPSLCFSESSDLVSQCS